MTAKNLCEWCVATSSEIDSIEWEMENLTRKVSMDISKGYTTYLLDALELWKPTKQSIEGFIAEAGEAWVEVLDDAFRNENGIYVEVKGE